MNTIKLTDLERLAIDFSNRNNKPYRKTTVKNLFIKKDKAGAYDEKSFIYNVKKLTVGRNTEVDNVIFCDAVISTVKSYTSSKSTAIDLIQSFTAFIAENKGPKFEVQYPAIPIDSTFERLMFITKYLQDPQSEIKDLEDELWQSERTIADDLKKLRGRDNDPISVCGRKFIVDDCERKNGHMSFASNVHPMFLTNNLTEVIAMLKGLKHMCEEPTMKPYALNVAGNIWVQLSDRAKNRIVYVLTELIPDDVEWYTSLEDKGSYAFSSERLISSVSRDCLMYVMKADEGCFIEYDGENGHEIIKADLVHFSWTDEITIIVNGSPRTIDKSKILCSALTIEQLAAAGD